MKFRLLLMAILSISLNAVPQTKDLPVRPKVGLVLSGGGAKGFAHIGALKLLDSLQIPVDYIAGTSMGGILGGLYALGHSGSDLETLARRDDWEEIFTDTPPRPELPYFQKVQTGRYQIEFGLHGLKPVPPSGLVYGQKVSLLLSELLFPFDHIQDFDQLPTPFRCVAVDLISGNEVVLNRGSLAKAIRATMSIPTVFSPVEWGDSLLVDGGFVNNLPTDVVKKMGAEIIIAVDVQSPFLRADQLTSALTVLEQTVSLVGTERWKKNLELADLYIHPDISSYSAADFYPDKIARILSNGEAAARKALPFMLALKEKYGLHRSENTAQMHNSAYRLHSIQIIGQTSATFDYFSDQLQLEPQDRLEAAHLQTCLANMRNSGRFSHIDYEVAPISDLDANLILRVQDKMKPIVRGIQIVDHKRLPFLFIYRLLGLQPGQRLNTARLNRRIMDIYGMGYFELFNYEVTPVDSDHVDLTFHVKERPFRKLRVGLRYDDHHKLVAALSVQSTNFLIPGMRLENEVQFAGLTQLSLRAYYPSRALNTPVYPFVHCFYKDISMDIFDDLGNKIAQYPDRSSGFGLGIGWVLGKSWNASIEYQQEEMDVTPNVAMPDPELFPSWHDRLRKIEASLTIDRLDQVFLPRRGFNLFLEQVFSMKELKTEVTYQQTRCALDVYKSLGRRHTLRGYAFYGHSSANTPIYKFFNQGRPQFFVGMQYDQLFASQLSLLRFDYRYEHRKDIVFELLANTAFNVQYHFHQDYHNKRPLLGAGLGVVLLSPIGPVEVIVSRGDKTYSANRKMQTCVFVTLGYHF